MANRDRMTFRSTMVAFINHERNGVNLNDTLFQLSKTCGSVKIFLEKCKEQEEWCLSPEANQMRVAQVPRAWIQCKSNIKRGMEKGLKPVEYPSMSKFRKALNSQAQTEGREGQANPKVGIASPGNDTVDRKDRGGALPHDLEKVAELLAPLNQLSRARAIKELEALAYRHRQYHDRSSQEGERRMSRKAAAGSGRVVNV